MAFAIEDDLAFAQALFAAVHGVVAGAVGGGFCRRVGDFTAAFDVNAAAAAQGAGGVVDVTFALHVQVARLDGAALVVHLAEGGVVGSARLKMAWVFQFAALCQWMCSALMWVLRPSMSPARFCCRAVGW